MSGVCEVCIVGEVGSRGYVDVVGYGLLLRLCI